MVAHPTNLLIWNPAAGGHLAAQVLPLVDELIAHAGVSFTRYETQSPNHASRIAAQIRTQLAAVEDEDAVLNVILLGGDGTTQEFLSGLYQAEQDCTPPCLRLILVPTGTANALYSALYPPASSSRHQPLEDDSQHGWRLRSLCAYLNDVDGKPSRLHPLTLAITTVEEQGDAPPRTILSHLITSHALHASILLDSEALRSSHPGIERFKLAAEKNLTRWIDGELILKRSKDSDPDPLNTLLQRYDPRKKTFVQVQGESVSIPGPFFYLASLTIDRLEPSFVPAPFGFAEDDPNPNPKTKTGGPSSSLSRPPRSLDVVLIRPTRDPLLASLLPTDLPAGMNPWDDEKKTLPAREKFVQRRVAPITAGMYNEGEHVHLFYPSEDVDVDGGGGGGVEEEEISQTASGRSVVEYWRVPAWHWKPRSDSERAGLVCLDGLLIQSTQTACRVFTELDGKVLVYH